MLCRRKNRAQPNSPIRDTTNPNPGAAGVPVVVEVAVVSAGVSVTIGVAVGGGGGVCPGVNVAAGVGAPMAFRAATGSVAKSG